MDEYINHLFSSSSWADGYARERSCWSYNETGQFNVMPPTSLRFHENGKGNLPLECLPAQDISSLAPDAELNHAVDKGLVSREARTEDEIQYSVDQVSPMMNCCLKMENVGMQYGTTLSTGPALHSVNLNYTKQLPVVDALSSFLSFNETSHVGCNRSEKLEHHKSFKDITSLLQFCPSPSYEGASSMSPIMGQDTTQRFDHQEVNMEDNLDFMRKKYVSMEQILQLDKMITPVASKDKENLASYPVSSFTTGSNSNITMATNGVSFPSQLDTTSTVPAGSYNGTSKPRVRARRGQATDPHSIAERLRREKIAERMKNLQELVPNSSKVDKASMLDEIIDYVKFLQLQVKVLSMSRLGAAGAVIPLITDGQAEGSNNLSLSPSAGQEIDIAPSADQIAFEQEVLKLMESNMTEAVQYLQSKGLCLMPMALAAAISSGKASISSSDSAEKKISFANGLVHGNSRGSRRVNNFSGTRTCQMSSSSDCNVKPEQLHDLGTIGNDCNGILKLQDAKNTFAREPSPKTEI